MDIKFIFVTIFVSLTTTVINICKGQECESCCVPNLAKYASCFKTCVVKCPTEAPETDLDSCGNPKARLSEDVKNTVLDYHNEVRGNLQPEPSNMMLMSWDDELARMAQSLADSCEFHHGFQEFCTKQDIAGQNIFIDMDTNSDVESKMLKAVDKWLSEQANYTLDTHTCDSGAICGHFTQLAWAESSQLGCAYKVCSTWTQNNEPQNTPGLYIVCNYAPQGNMLGVRPYKAGLPCSNCASVISGNKAKCVDSKWCEACPDDSTDPDCKFPAFPCRNGGVFDFSTGVCTCTADYFGKDCQHVVADGCNNGSFDPANKVCTCDGGYCGEVCDNQNTETEVNCQFFEGQGYCDPSSNLFTFVSGVCACECAKIIDG